MHRRHRSIGHGVGCEPRLEKLTPRHALIVLGGKPSRIEQGGWEKRRTEHSHADPMRPQLGMKRFRERHQRRLGEVVGRHAWKRSDGGQRGGVDQIAATRIPFQPIDKRVAAVDRIPDVDVHDPVPVLQRALPHLPRHRHASIIDKQVELRPVCLETLSQAAPGGGICHIEPFDPPFPAGIPHKLQRLGGAYLVDIADGDLPAIAGQPPAESPAQPAGSPGDNGSAARGHRKDEPGRYGGSAGGTTAAASDRLRSLQSLAARRVNHTVAHPSRTINSGI